jgi:hypothetical protein
VLSSSFGGGLETFPVGSPLVKEERLGECLKLRKVRKRREGEVHWVVGCCVECHLLSCL